MVKLRVVDTNTITMRHMIRICSVIPNFFFLDVEEDDVNIPSEINSCVIKAASDNESLAYLAEL